MLFIGTRFSNLYTEVDTTARGIVGSCCDAGVLRVAVKMIPEFVYSKESACACVMAERFQVRDGQPQLLAVPHCPVLHHLCFVEVH